MEKENYSKYDLIKRILVSNLEEDVKEAIVNELISEHKSYPLWYASNNTDAVAKSTPSIQLYSEEKK